MKSPKLDNIPDMPFDRQKPNPRATIGHNQPPPLTESKKDEFDRLLAQARDGKMMETISKFVTGGERLGQFSGPEAEEDAHAGTRIVKISSDDQFAKVGDFVKGCSGLAKLIDEKRKEITDPLYQTQREVKAHADAKAEPLIIAERKGRMLLNDYAEEQRKERQRKADAEREAWEAQQKAEADAARAAAEEGGDMSSLAEPAPSAAPPKAQERLKTRSDFGTTTSSATEWIAEIAGKTRGLPDSILENEKVREAVTKVLQQRAKSGERKIKGANIFERAVARVR